MGCNREKGRVPLDWEMEMEMEHSLISEYRSINKNKIKNKNLRIEIMFLA